MENWEKIIVYTWAAGFTIGLGGMFACFEKIRPNWLEQEIRHGIIAFGGGALLSAVSLVLVPRGIENLSVLAVILCFTGGAAIFATLSYFTEKSGTPVGNLTAMLSDYVPEAIALGATMSLGDSGLLIAILIGLQNFPEGFNSYREIISNTKYSRKKTLIFMFVLSLLGPLFGLLGYFIVGDQNEVLSGILLVSSSGILYLIFKDIAPQAEMKKTWLPPLGAILGFMLGLIGHMLLLP